MNNTFRIVNAQIVNEGEIFSGTVLCKDGIIEQVTRDQKEGKVPENDDVKTINSKDHPFRVVPQFKNDAVVEEGYLNALLPKLSWNVIRISTKQNWQRLLDI